MHIVTSVLDRLGPTKLDVNRSKIGVTGSETLISLAHQDTDRGDIHIAVAESGWTNLYGPHGHDEVYSRGDQWAVDLEESVSSILTGRFRVRRDGGRSPRTPLD